MMSTVGICQTWRDRLGTFWRCLRDCSNASVQRCGHETVGLDLGGHRTSLWIRHARRFDRGCVQENTKRRSKVRFNELYPLLNCSRQCHHSKLWRCLSQSWCRWVCRTQGNHWSWDTTTWAEAHFQGTAQRLIYIRLAAEDRQKYGEDKVGRLIKSMYGTQDASHIWKLDHVNLICGELGGFRRGKHSAALFHNPNQDVRWQCTAMTLCVCQMTMDSDTSTVFSYPNIRQKTWEHWDSKIQTWKAFCCWTVCSELELIKLDSAWTLNLTWDTLHSSSVNQDAIRTRKRWAHHEINYRTNWCWTEDGVRFWRKMMPARYRSGCMRLSYLAQDRLNLAETAKHLAQRMSEPREFDFVPLKRAAQYLVGKPKAALRYRRQRHVDKITVFVDSDFAGDPVLREHDGIGGSDR